MDQQEPDRDYEQRPFLQQVWVQAVNVNELCLLRPQSEGACPLSREGGGRSVTSALLPASSIHWRARGENELLERSRGWLPMVSSACLVQSSCCDFVIVICRLGCWIREATSLINDA